MVYFNQSTYFVLAPRHKIEAPRAAELLFFEKMATLASSWYCAAKIPCSCHRFHPLVCARRRRVGLEPLEEEDEHHLGSSIQFSSFEFEITCASNHQWLSGGRRGITMG
jgi:hypothetical protein